MRNIFDQYSQPENRLTHSLVASLYEDKKLLNSFVKEFFRGFFDKNSILKIDQQTLPGYESLKADENQKKGLPDAIIFSEDQCIIIESKIKSDLKKNQLVRHENTIKRKGFNNIIGATITVDIISNINLDNWRHLTWNQIYKWVYNKTKNSIWAKILLEYFNVAENKMVEDEYLIEGSITEFTGVNFNENNPYSYLEGKRIIKLITNKVRQNKILEDELNADLYGKGRSGIKKDTWLWDFLTFKSNVKKIFTHQPHLTVSLNKNCLAAAITVPHSVKGDAKENFYNISWEEFRNIIYKIGKNYANYFGQSGGFKPVINTVQRRYRSQSSPPIIDGRISIDIRTAFDDLSSQLKPNQKTQKEWLKAVFEIITNKKSNIQFQVGAEFFYNKDTLVNNKDADKVVVKSFLACKPLIKYLFK